MTGRLFVKILLPARTPASSAPLAGRGTISRSTVDDHAIQDRQRCRRRAEACPSASSRPGSAQSGRKPDRLESRLRIKERGFSFWWLKLDGGRRSRRPKA